MRGENEERPPLTASEIETIRSQVSSFVNDTTLDSSLHCGGIEVLDKPSLQSLVVPGFNPVSSSRIPHRLERNSIIMFRGLLFWICAPQV